MRAMEFITENRIYNEQTFNNWLMNYANEIPVEKTKLWFIKKIGNLVKNDPTNQTNVSLEPDANEWDKKDYQNGTLVNFRPNPTTEQKLSHVVDWLRAMPVGHAFEKALPGIQTIDIANQWADKYFTEQNKKYELEQLKNNPNANKDKIRKLEVKVAKREPEDGTKEIFTDEDMVWVEVFGVNSLNREGSLMQHCVGGYADKVANGTKIISLRDSGNNPHCTLEINGNSIKQIKGKQNKAPVEKFIPYIKNFITHFKYDVVGNLKNIGLVKINNKIYDVNNLNNLPEGLTVYDDLFLKGCVGLTRLPEGLTVNGDLILDGCTGLTSLPKGLTVGRNLYLVDCTGLTSLPEGLTVDGNLFLNGCVGLSRLPEGLTVNIGLYLQGCPAKMPKKYIVKGKIVK